MLSISRNIYDKIYYSKVGKPFQGKSVKKIAYPQGDANFGKNLAILLE